MAKLIRILVFAITSAIISVVFNETQEISLRIVSAIASGFFGAAISALYEYVDTKGQGIKTWFLSQILYSKENIYVSFSYLYRIEVDGKFLLVRGNRLPNQYQPAGGVYKYYDEAKSFLTELKYTPNTEMGNGNETDDLRLSMKGKYFLKFMEWFLAMKDREYDPTREFAEELIETDILPENEFRKIKYRKVWEHNVGFTWSQPLRKHEVIYADIFELKLTERQKEIIRNAAQNHPDKICLATPDEMKCRRYNGSVEMNLSNNTPWLLGEE